MRVSCLKTLPLLYFPCRKTMSRSYCMSKSTDPIKQLHAFFTDKLHIDLCKNPISVKTEGDSIVMEGLVEGIALKKKAVLEAMGIAGSDGVVDRLKVIPSNGLSDAEIKKHLSDAFLSETTLSGMDIEIDVKAGVVDIEGSVPSLSHKRLAGVLAWWVPGSMDVINSLEVNPEEKDSDDELAEALRLVLEKDPLVDAAAISIKAKDWVVELGGIVKSEAEKQAAEHDAWYVWGVNEVVNRIKASGKTG